MNLCDVSGEPGEWRDWRESDDGLLATFRCARADVAAAQRRLFRAIAACDRAGLWRADGCRDMAQWLSGQVGISNWSAARWVGAAHAVEDLPGLSTALEDGTLGLDKVVDLARCATRETEARLIAWARRVSAATVRRHADLACRPDLAEEVGADRGRYLQGWWTEDRTSYGIAGRFPAAQGAVIEKALERVAARVPEDPSLALPDGSPLTYEGRREARRADALFVLAAGALGADPDSPRGSVLIHASLDALAGNGGGCEIEGGPVVHPEVARRLACDGRLQVVVHDRAGRTVGIGRAGRTPPSWLARALRHRDERCTFPGCDLRRFVHAHHITPWPEGGRTDLDNLVLVCGFHHKLVHEHGWRVELDEPGTARWFRPDGRRFDPGAGPARRLDRAPPIYRAPQRARSLSRR